MTSEHERMSKLRFLSFSVRSLSVYPVLDYVLVHALPCLICGDAFSVNKNDAILKLTSRRVVKAHLLRRNTRVASRNADATANQKQQ